MMKVDINDLSCYKEIHAVRLPGEKQHEVRVAGEKPHEVRVAGEKQHEVTLHNLPNSFSWHPEIKLLAS